jgi:hypothetical protein
MKKVSFFILSILSLITNVSSFKGCENDQMNELCQSKAVDHCYTCVEVTKETYPHPPVCVPVFHNNLGVLENYPRDHWNCTIYRPTIITDPIQEAIDQTNKLEKEICLIDEFISDLCEHEDKNGFCLIANYIHDICENKNEEEDQSTSYHLKTQNYQVSDYISPWGSKSQCINSDYKEICSDNITKACFDCRTPTLKIGPITSYYHLCFPLFASENETNLVKRLKNENWECKKFSNPRYKPSKLYSACSGSICQKEGWTYRGNHFGKEWCGNSPCNEYFGNRVLCSFPTNCNSKKSLLSIQDDYHKEFQTLGCGLEKFKCMIRKDCRNLVKQLENCKNDQSCILSILIQNDDETFLKLTKCMFAN